MDNENQRELDVLAALEGIHRMPREHPGHGAGHSGGDRDHLPPLALSAAPARSGPPSDGDLAPGRGGGVGGHPGEWRDAEQRRSLGDRLASDAAVAQVIRAANVYRDRLGYGPIESEVEA